VEADAEVLMGGLRRPARWGTDVGMQVEHMQVSGAGSGAVELVSC
jgi:hypothetical protein